MCQNCVRTVERLHAALEASDQVVAKAIGLSEFAQMARAETRLRELMLLKWNQRRARAVRMAVAATRRGNGAGSIASIAKKQMKGWADDVIRPTMRTIDQAYRLGKQSMLARAFGPKRKAPEYTTPNFTQEVTKAVKIPKAGFGLVDKAAVRALQKQHMFWIGGVFGSGVSGPVSETVKETIIQAGSDRKVAAELMEKRLAATLGKVALPSGWTGSSAQYFEGMAADAVTKARVTGQITTLVDLGVTHYTISNPSDKRTCPVCSHLEGKVYTIQHGTRQMESDLKATEPDALRKSHPWVSPKELKTISPKGGHTSAADSKKLADAGIALPPFHFRCRCTVDIDSSAPVTVTPAAIAPPTNPATLAKRPEVRRLASKAMWLKNLTQREQQAFKNWSFGGFKQMRHWDAGLADDAWMASQKAGWWNNATTNKEAVKDLEIIRGSLAKSPEFKGKVFRGVSRLTPAQAEAIAKKGNVIELDAISSWTKEKKWANHFAANPNMSVSERFVTMEVKTSKGGAFDVADWSITNAKEKEVMLEKGKKLKVKSVKATTIKDGHKTRRGFHVVLEELE